LFGDVGSRRIEMQIGNKKRGCGHDASAGPIRQLLRH
jgi:hypothetical protein